MEPIQRLEIELVATGLGPSPGSRLHPSVSSELFQGLLFWLFKRDFKGSFKGDTDIDTVVEVDVDLVFRFGPFKGDFKVCLGIVSWYRSSSGTDFDNYEIASSEIASPVLIGSYYGNC